ncbi:hypothetical protein LTR02_016864 [Friedmanniomyces endolithicus]|nr:hypothetical protein LTR02_016864 [Friedmanniomyces endolithicus]
MRKPSLFGNNLNDVESVGVELRFDLVPSRHSQSLLAGLPTESRLINDLYTPSAPIPALHTPSPRPLDRTAALNLWQPLERVSTLACRILDPQPLLQTLYLHPEQAPILALAQGVLEVWQPPWLLLEATRRRKDDVGYFRARRFGFPRQKEVDGGSLRVCPQFLADDAEIWTGIGLEDDLLSGSFETLRVWVFHFIEFPGIGAHEGLLRRATAQAGSV